MNRSSASFALSAAALSTVSLAASALSPIGISSAQAASSLFSEQSVDASQFVVMAAPRNDTDYNLVVIEQKSSRRDCWSESNGVVNPLLLDFDFSGICGRATDSNGYSLRMAGEDLGLKYSLRLVDRGNYVALLAAPNRRNQSTLEIGRTKAVGQDYLAIDLNPGWNLSRRVYDGKALGHIYFSNETALANTVAAAPAGQPAVSKPVISKPVISRPVVSKPVTSKPIAAKPITVAPQPTTAPELEIIAIGQPLPEPPFLPTNAPSAPVVLSVEQPLAVAVEIPVTDLSATDLSDFEIPAEAAPEAVAVVDDNPLASQLHYAELNAVYQEILARPVDASGLATYGDRLDQGRGLDWVSDRLRNSDEGKTVAINRLYREVLGRDVDAGGLRTYRKRLNRGWTLSQLRSHLANSTEARQRVANR